MSLPADQRRKLVALLGQLGHDNTHVRAASGAAADRIVRAANLSWDDVIAQPVQALEEEADEGRDADQNCTVGDVYTAKRFAEILEVAAENAASEWERSFVESIARLHRKWGQRTMLSPKQWAVIERLAEIDP